MEGDNMPKQAINKFRLMVLTVFMATSSVSMAGTFMAGAASTDITPDVNKWEVNSIGYFSQKVMTEVLDRQYCQALAVSDGENEAVIVTCDLMGTPPVLRQKIIKGLKGTKINDNNLLISCSHTHSGAGNMMPNFIAKIGFGPYIEELTQRTADRIIGAVKEARSTMKPAVINVAETELKNVTRNRRDPAGSYDYGTRRFTDAYDPDNHLNDTDPTLTVIKIDSTGGEPIALLFHFSTHGTVLGAEVLTLSADWPGYARARVEKGAPGYVAMYMNGAQGDQAPAMDDGDPATDVEYLDIIGKKVADGVLAIINKTEPADAAPVKSVMVRRQVPPGKWKMGVELGGKSVELKIPKWVVKKYFSELPLQAVRIGDLVFMALPIEAVAEVGLSMKQGAKGIGADYALVAGLANDHLLYAATPEDFGEGGYEVESTVIGQMEAGLIIGEQMMLVRKLYQD
jgi:hypothetical protein